MSQNVHVAVRSHAGRRSELLEVIHTVAERARAFPGCEGFEVYSGSDDPDLVIEWMKFTDRSDQEAFGASLAETGIMEQVMGLLAEAPQRTFLTAHPDV
jgi:quinol monooxygenase YgiN|tara:strand:- start:775 stop:1071 length:297 start_codon:yes stop_codon:yes gene_type:complete